MCVFGMKWKVSFYVSSPKLRSGFELNLVIDVLITVTTKIAVFWDVIPWRVVEIK